MAEGASRIPWKSLLVVPLTPFTEILTSNAPPDPEDGLASANRTLKIVWFVSVVPVVVKL